MKCKWLTLTAVIGLTLSLALLPALAQAAPLALPPRPTLPPTATPKPAPTPTVMPTPQPTPLVGGLIVLRASSAQAAQWTVVQWQDGHGGWHDVDGWQGTFDEIVYDWQTGRSTGYKIWWVSPADLGTGPFRWVIYRKPKDGLLMASQAFFLPGHAGQQITVEVAIPSRSR